MTLASLHRGLFSNPFFMFQLTNSANEIGFHVFKGEAHVLQSCYSFCSKSDIGTIKENIWKYTRIKPRSAVLRFEGENGKTIYAYDNLSLMDIDNMRRDGVAEYEIQKQNFYILMPKQAIR